MGSRIVLLVGLALAAVLPAASGARSGPVTLVTAKDKIVAFAQDRGQLVWRVADDGCDFGPISSTYERAAAGGRTTLLEKDGPCGFDQTELALGGRQAIWTTRQGGNNLYTQVTTAEPGTKPKPLEHALSDTEGMYFDALGDGSFPGAIVGDGTVLAYSVIAVGFVDETCRPEEGEQCDRAAGGVTYLAEHGRKRVIKGAGGAVALAAAAPNIAIVPVAAANYVDPMGDGGIVEPTATTVAVRNARTGRLVSSFDPTGTPRAVALTSRIVAVLVDQPKTRRIEIRDARTGKLLRNVAVPRATTNALSAADGVIVYAVNRDPDSFESSPHDIYALDTSTYKARRLIRTAYTPVGLSVEGSRVAWAVSAPYAKHFAAIKAIYLN